MPQESPLFGTDLDLRASNLDDVAELSFDVRDVTRVLFGGKAGPHNFFIGSTVSYTPTFESRGTQLRGASAHVISASASTALLTNSGIYVGDTPNATITLQATAVA